MVNAALAEDTAERAAPAAAVPCGAATYPG